MEDNFTRDEFEEFLQDQVRNHRMYPKDTVWREINKKLHEDKKWPALTIAAMAFITASIIISVYFTPKANIFAIKPSIEPVGTLPSNKKGDNVLNKLTSSTPFSPSKTNSQSSLGVEAKAEPVASVGVIQPNNPARKLVDKSGGMERISKVEQATIKIRPGISKNSEHQNILSENAAPVESVNSKNSENAKNEAPLVTSDKKATDKKLRINAPLSSPRDDNDKNMVDKFLKEQPLGSGSSTYVKAKGVKNKFSFQVYAAPSISYRKLLEDRSMLEVGKTTGAGPVGLNYVTDVNNVVRHKPGTGIEVGVSFMYNLSQKFRVKSGLQFNVRQYSIEAYRSGTEVASIALRRNNGFDTVNTIANYRNNNGHYSAELVNRYYQLSIPVGVEWEVMGNNRIKLNVAATIQPTYLLNRNAYLLSTNFKNYTESPDMIRNWNLNSNIEAFLSFKSGDFKWQIGPQLRYQPYSTFIPQYPIKEHLLDYGIKVGISKSMR